MTGSSGFSGELGLTLWALLCVGFWLTVVVSGSLRVQRGLAYGCVALMFVDIPAIAIAGGRVRPYHVASLLLVGVFLRARVGALRKDPGGVLVLLLAGATVFDLVSLAWSESPTDTVQVGVGQLLLLVILVTLRRLLRLGAVTPSGVLRATLVGATACSVAGIVEFVLAYAGSTWQIYDVVGIPWHRPAGLMTEPDWAGLVAGIGLVIAYFGDWPARLRAWALWSCGAVVLLTAVRAVWLALICVIAVSLVADRSLRRRARRLAALAVPLVVGGVVFVSLHPSAISRLSPSAVASSHGDQGSVNSRLGVFDLIMDGVPGTELLGHGAGTLAYASSLDVNRDRYAGGGDLNAGHGSANIFATALWDHGYPGLVLMVVIVGAWLRAARRHPELGHLLFPVSLLLVIDFQINNGFRFGFVWLMLALASCHRYPTAPIHDHGAMRTPNERGLASAGSPSR